MVAKMTKKRKMTIGGFHRWNEYFGFGTIELAQSFDLTECELKDLLDKIKVAFETNPKEKFYIDNIKIIVAKERKEHNDKKYTATKYIITKGANRAWIMILLGICFGQMRAYCELWRDLLWTAILMPTQKDDENKFEAFMKQVLFPNFMPKLCDYARDLGISENIANSLQTIEFWFDDNFGKQCVFKKGNAICEKFAEFVYKKVCFEIELAEICANRK